MRGSRYSIASLMGTILVAALGLAALRSGSNNWAAAMLFATCGLVILATVGAVCRQGEERAWWLGFALFGWCYLILMFGRGYPPFFSPLNAVFDSLRSKFGGPFPAKHFGDDSFAQICHCFVCLMAALFGGFTSRLLFGARVEPGEPVPRKHLRKGLVWLVVLALVASLVLIGFSRSPSLWTAFVFMITCGILGMTLVVAISSKGTRRVMGLGAALFGIGYMLLIFEHGETATNWPHVATNQFLSSVSEFIPGFIRVFPSTLDEVEAANARIVKALNEQVPLHFRNETPLEDVLRKIEADMKQKIPIYVDPVGLQEAEKTLQSPVTIDLEGASLRKTLRLILAQLGMTYHVKDGVLVITNIDSEDSELATHEDPFLIVGQCFIALFAALIGAILAPFAAGRAALDGAESR